jgi:hypothetical protein
LSELASSLTSGGYVRRRDFIKSIAGSVVWPVVTRAQQPDQIRRIGVIMSWI